MAYIVVKGVRRASIATWWNEAREINYLDLGSHRAYLNVTGYTEYRREARIYVDTGREG